MPPSRASQREPGTCAYGTDAHATCGHDRKAHKFDPVDDSSWCDECYADTDKALNEIAYHYFDQGMYAKV